jgi:hypothetical protein
LTKRPAACEQVISAGIWWSSCWAPNRFAANLTTAIDPPQCCFSCSPRAYRVQFPVDGREKPTARPRSLSRIQVRVGHKCSQLNTTVVGARRRAAGILPRLAPPQSNRDRPGTCIGTRVRFC